MYSEKFIKEDVIPSLELLASQPVTINPKRKQDSTAVTLWKKYINDNFNDKVKDPVKTISFDAGAVYEEVYQTENTTETSSVFNDGGFVAAGISTELDFLGGVEAGFTMTYTHNKEETDFNSNVGQYGYYVPFRR